MSTAELQVAPRCWQGYLCLPSARIPALSRLSLLRIAGLPLCAGAKPAESTSARLKKLKDLKALKRRKAWEAHVDEASGMPYWFNKETGESSWDDPTKCVVLFFSPQRDFFP